MHCPLDDAACAGPHDREDDLPVRSSHDRDGLGHRRPPLDALDRRKPATWREIDVSEHHSRLEPVDQADQRFGRRGRNRSNVRRALEHSNDAGSEGAVRVGDDHYKLPAAQSATSHRRSTCIPRITRRDGVRHRSPSDAARPTQTQEPYRPFPSQSRLQFGVDLSKRPNVSDESPGIPTAMPPRPYASASLRRAYLTPARGDRHYRDIA